METSPDPNREMILLEQIEFDPDITQASLASQLGVAVGTVNWHLKRLIAKGYVKVKRAQRRKLRYIITPEGIAFRARLTVNYIEQSMYLYRLVRERVREALLDLKRSGHAAVRIQAEGDLADICKLTCLELGISITDSPDAPVVEIHGLQVFIQQAGMTTIKPPGGDGKVS
jgi:DNA-binding MarR family transcriptional regulator